MLASDAGKRLVALAALDYLPATYQSLAARACEEAKVEMSPWRRAVPRTSGQDWPALAIAGLPSGVRRLAPDLNALLTEEYPKLPLLLLCEEGLVRPTVVSHGGRVVLLGAPLSRSRVSSRIKMLAANADPEHRSRSSGLSSGEWQIRDRLSARHWVGSLASGKGVAAPYLDEPSPSALVALLPLTEHAASGELSREVSRELCSTSSVARKEAALSELLADRYAALYLAASASEWSIYRPHSTVSLRLCSPERLPRIWDLGETHTHSKLFTTTAASGDLLILSSAPHQRLWPEAAVDMWDGGPALLASLASRKSDDGKPFSVLMMELF